MVWAGIMQDTRTSLHVFDKDSVNAQRYRQKVLNRIEHVSNALRRAITMRQPLPRTILELKIALVENERVYHKHSLIPLLTACILVVHAICLSGMTIHHTRGNTHCTSLSFIVVFYPYVQTT